MDKPNVIVIVGPTASGKTSLSIELAKKINGEIISCDSMQIYKEMNIGTAKPSLEEREGIKHYLIDIVEPNERYSVSNFKCDAENAINEIILNKKIPILVGGTGLYVNSLIYGIEMVENAFNEQIRKKLEERVLTDGLENLYEEAVKIDSIAMEKISKNDKKRILRVLEIYYSTGITKTEQDLKSRLNEVKYNYHVFGLDMEREILYNRINLRVDKMLEDGLIEEVQKIRQKYNCFPTAMQGIGYKEVVEYLDGKISKDEMIDKIKIESRRYAKRQLTWFRRNNQIKWLDGLSEKEKNIQIIMEDCKIE